MSDVASGVRSSSDQSMSSTSSTTRRDPEGWRTRGRWAGIAFVALAGFGVPRLLTPFWLGVVTDGLILGFAALGVGYLFGKSHLLSLGHTMFFGGSAYLFGIAVVRWSLSGEVALLLGLGGAAVVGVAIAAIAVRVPELGFAILTLAFAQALMVWLTSTGMRSLAGGQDGIRLPSDVTIFGVAVGDLRSPSQLWPVVWILLLLVIALLVYVDRSRWGKILTAVRENEDRAPFVGLGTYWPRVWLFVLTGSLASLSGLLLSLRHGFIGPGMLHWGTAADMLVAAIVGGVGVIVGPVVGSLGIGLVTNVLRSITEHVGIVIGMLFIVVVVVAPGGLMSLWRRRR